VQHRPVIRTAVPKRRYQLGDFSAVVLGEVESGDDNHYQYILAVLRSGDAEPGIYLTAERTRPGQGSAEGLAMRLVMRDGSAVIGRSDRWAGLDEFTEDALTAVRKILGLEGEEAFRLQ
jgi:hypothetical protein